MRLGLLRRDVMGVRASNRRGGEAGQAKAQVKLDGGGPPGGDGDEVPSGGVQRQGQAGLWARSRAQARLVVL